MGTLTFVKGGQHHLEFETRNGNFVLRAFEQKNVLSDSCSPGVVDSFHSLHYGLS